MENETRDTGIDAIGKVPWGFHICLLYKTEQDLTDIFLPYLKSGLESNESCLLILEKPSDCKKTAVKLAANIADFDKYLKKGQLEIADYKKWYFKNNKFSMKTAIDNGARKVKKSLESKYQGLRVFADMAWFKKTERKNLLEYEEQVNQNIGEYKVLTVCAYPVDKLQANEVVDMIRTHQFVLFRGSDKWSFFSGFEDSNIEMAMRKAKELFPLFMRKDKGTTDFREIFMTRIKEERKRRGLTQSEFAKKAGISLNFLGQLERGSRTPNFKKVIQIAEALDMDLKYLLGELKIKPAEKDKFKEKIMAVLNTSSVKEKNLFYKVISFLAENIKGSK